MSDFFVNVPPSNFLSSFNFAIYYNLFTHVFRVGNVIFHYFHIVLFTMITDFDNFNVDFVCWNENMLHFISLWNLLFIFYSNKKIISSFFIEKNARKYNYMCFYLKSRCYQRIELEKRCKYNKISSSLLYTQCFACSILW